MAKRKNTDGTKFLRYFGPLLEALRKLYGAESLAEELTEKQKKD